MLYHFTTKNGVEVRCPICRSNTMEKQKEIVTIDNGLCENTEASIVSLVCSECSFKLTFADGSYW